MPTIYQGECSACGRKTSIMPAEYGAVLVDTPIEQSQHQIVGAVFLDREGGPLASATEPSLVILSHPAESSILASTGFTWDDLRREGRYVQCTNVVCDACGQLFALKRIAVPTGCSGCVIPLVVGTAGGLAIGIWRSSALLGWLAAVGVGYLVAIALESWTRRGMKNYFPERAAKLAAERSCPGCGSEASTAITERKPLRCPACRGTAVHFRIVGKS